MRRDHLVTSPRRRFFVATTLAFAAVFAVSTAVAGGGLRDILRGSQIIEDEADDRLNALDRELDGLRGVMSELPRKERRQLRRKMARMDQLIDELRDDTDALAQLVVEASDEARSRRGRRHADVEPRRGYHQPPPSRSACTKNDFKNVLHAVDTEWFDSGRMEVLQSAIGDRWFTVAQVETLVGKFSFDSYQVDAAAMLHGRTVDLENWYRVYDSLTFSSSKRELRRRVGV